MKFSYVLPDPGSYKDWAEFEDDLACLKQAGYDAVELQIADPVSLDEERLRRSLQDSGCRLCAVQTGATYAACGNCLCTARKEVRSRTVALLKSFVGLASRFGSIVVFGSLQGRVKDEPDLEKGRRRIIEALTVIGRYAARHGVTVACEPVNHLETAYHNTIEQVRRLVQELKLPAVRMMVDTFHMNIEEKLMLEPLAAIRGLLVHVHLSETNRNFLGSGRWDTAAFLAELERLGYQGYCSVGVYNTCLSQQECMVRCRGALQAIKG